MKNYKVEKIDEDKYQVEIAKDKYVVCNAKTKEEAKQKAYNKRF